MTTYYKDFQTAAKKIIEHVGKNIVLAVPIGIGKPVGLINAFYQLALADKSIQLTIITALTLARPLLSNELEKRFMTPLLDRLLKNFEDPLYEKPRQLQQLPENIHVIEFFLTPGKYLQNSYVQQHYISSKYTSVAQDVASYPVNVIAQQVASAKNQPHYSLSCNTDLFADTLKQLKNAEQKGRKIAVAAEVNANMPFLLGDEAIVSADTFTDIIDTGHYPTLFPLPREELSAADHLIGLYTSYLIKDNGCLQIGIGKLSNAVAAALILRQKENKLYQALYQQLAISEKFGDSVLTIGGRDTFQKGLYASTELLSGEYLELYRADILKKRVYDHLGLQALLNAAVISEVIKPDIIDILLTNKIINPHLSAADCQFLQQFGIFKPSVSFQGDHLLLPSGETISLDLTVASAKQKIIANCLGEKLQSGHIIHAAFFLGSANFYEQLRQLTNEELQQINMTTIARTNKLSWSYELLKAQRKNSRFVNSALMVTLGGACISDGLANIQEISGVGGQFDFVNMAQNLEDARSIINCRSTVRLNGKLQTNVVWNYSNITIPRYLRDIVVTEYGIADCRSKIDVENIKALLNIADSRFQPALLKKAKYYKKIPQDYEIPLQFQQNYPEKIASVVKELQLKGYCKPYPFGSELTDEEQILARALLHLKKANKMQLLKLLLISLFYFGKNTQCEACLSRMQLSQPKNFKEFLYKKLLNYIIAQSPAH